MATGRTGFLSLAGLGVAGVLLMSACSDDDNGGAFSVARAEASRDEEPAVTTAELAPLVEGNTAFATDLYGALRGEDGNLFFSPYSISVALAMTYAGAAGDTATEMAGTMHFDLPQDRLHPAFNRLDLELESRADVESAGDDEAEPFQLSIVNSIWAEKTYELLDAYLETLAVNYDAGARLVDFINDPDGSRETINAWVSDETNERIPELIPQDVIDVMTRLVLTNAIFFKASWASQFEEAVTQSGDFHRLDGSTVTAEMMRQQHGFAYAEGDGYQALEMPYEGDEVAMLVVLPEEGSFEDFEAGFDAEGLAGIVAGLEPQTINVALPKFEFSSDVPLSQVLASLGMPTAFAPGVADFSGMDGTRDLYIQDVLHKAFVAVDETGTEAAAATAVVVGVTSAPLDPKTFEADRPFIFLIRDRVTGTILFAGRVIDPTP